VIYFVQCVDGGPVKIGTTADLDSRLRTLESHYGRPLALLATMPGGRDEERAVHERFAHLRLNGKSHRGRQPEQFRPGPDLMNFIGKPLFVNQGDVELMEGSDTREVILSLQCCPEFRRWLKGLADHCRTPIMTIMDHALVYYAEKTGFAEPAPMRTMRR
jgi:hypothetical protein